jgi:hypothetical protein
MTAELEDWLKQATRCLSRDAAARVRAEITDHFAGAVEAGDTAHAALAALGDPRTANRQYRNVMLTSAEARLLRDGNWEARAVCSRPWLKWALLALPVAALWVAAHDRDLLPGAVCVALLVLAPFLPVYTPLRGRVFRVVKWGLFVVALGFGLQWSWLWIACLSPLATIEWRRVSIRRKIPVAQWPKQLYL